MKYILICIAALLVCLSIGFYLAYFVTRRLGKSGKPLLTAVLTIVFGSFTMVGLTLGYLSVYYAPTERAEAALTGSETVTVTPVSGGYLFDGPGTSTALVFYPGAKVASEAYSPLMMRISEQGVDCFLADMPFHFAIFGGETANRFLSAYHYDTWVMSGHSMGGLVAANYAAAHPDQIDGLVLLASYTTKPVAEHLQLLSIYGSEDGCLNRKAYENAKASWQESAVEYVIEGGNHAQFGDYGEQKSDSAASISSEEQQMKTAELICNFWAE